METASLVLQLIFIVGIIFLIYYFLKDPLPILRSFIRFFRYHHNILVVALSIIIWGPFWLKLEMRLMK